MRNLPCLLLYLLTLTLLCGRLTIVAAAELDDARLAQRLNQLDASLLSLCRDECYFLNEGDPAVARLLTEERTLLERRALQYLASHRPLDDKDFGTLFKSLGASVAAHAVPLDGTTYLVAIFYSPSQELGEVIIVSSHGDHAEITWRRSSSPCKGTPAEGGSCSSATALVDIGSLPTKAGRNHFFYIEEYQRHEAGCGLEKNFLSIWEWDGGKAARRLQEEYASWCELSEPPRFDGKILHIDAMHLFRTMWHRPPPLLRDDWRIAVGRRQIVDLGQPSSVPEVDLIDELIYRITHKGDAAALASPAVVAFIQENIVKPGLHISSDRFEYSDLKYEDSRVTNRSNDTAVCLMLSIPSNPGKEEAHPFLFTTTKAGSKPFVSDAELVSKEIQDELCPKHED